MTDFIKQGDDPNTAYEKSKRSVRSYLLMLLRSSIRERIRGGSEMALFESYERRIDKINAVLN